MFPRVTSQTQGTREDTSSNGHMLRAQLWRFPPLPSQNHRGYQGTRYKLHFTAGKAEAQSGRGTCQGHTARSAEVHIHH